MGRLSGFLVTLRQMGRPRVTTQYPKVKHDKPARQHGRQLIEAALVDVKAEPSSDHLTELLGRRLALVFIGGCRRNDRVQCAIDRRTERDRGTEENADATRHGCELGVGRRRVGIPDRPGRALGHCANEDCRRRRDEDARHDRQ
jgi:hypothetical protein